MAIKFTRATLNGLPVKEKTYEIYDTGVTGLFIRVYASGKRKYVVEYARKKKETIGTVGIVTLEGAREEAIRLIQLAKNNGGTLPQNKLGGLSLKAFIDDHYAEWITVNLKNHKKDLSTLRSAFKPLMPCRLDQITYKQIDDLRTQWRREGNKPSTVNRKTTTLKGLLTRAVKRKDITTSPLLAMQDLPIDKNPNPRYLSQEEETNLFVQLDARESKMREERESANEWRLQRNKPLLPHLDRQEFADHLKPMVIILLKTGMRRGELFKLQWKDIFFSIGHLTVGDSKNFQSRNIPIHPAVEKALKLWRSGTKPESYVFPGVAGGPMTDIKTSFTKIIQDSKITNFRLHDMRHTFASNLVMKGVPLNTVRELLGHTDMKMTIRYAHLSPNNLSSAVNLL